jgi:hypothetical protein
MGETSAVETNQRSHPSDGVETGNSTVRGRSEFCHGSPYHSKLNGTGCHLKSELNRSNHGEKVVRQFLGLKKSTSMPVESECADHLAFVNFHSTR